MKLVGYRRVSTSKQLEVGFGLDVQTDVITSWAEKNGHTLLRIETDGAISGTTDADERPGFTAALDAIVDGYAEGMLIPRLDRLARALTVQEALLASIWRENAKVFTCDAGEVEADDPDDPMRTAMRQMVGVFAQLDRAMINKRLRDGRKAKAKQGGFAYGSVPYGFKSVDGVLVADEQELKVVQIIVDLSNKGVPTRSIAGRLNGWGHTTKRGNPWSSPRVSDVLTRQRVMARVSG